MKILKKIIAVGLIAVLTGNSFVYAQAPGQRSAKECQTILKEDTVKMNEFGGALLITGTITAVAAGLYSIYKGMGDVAPGRASLRLSYHLNEAKESLIKDALEYATEKNDNALKTVMRNFASNKSATYVDVISFLEERELRGLSNYLNSSIFAGRMNNTMPESVSRTLYKYIMEVEQLRTHYVNTGVTVDILLKKEELYAKIENLLNVKLTRSVEEITAHSIPQGQRQAYLKLSDKLTNAYINKDFAVMEKLLKAESNSGKSYLFKKGLKRMFFLGSFLIIVSVAMDTSKTDKQLARINENFALFLQADDNLLAAIDKNEDYLKVINIITDGYHEIANASLKEQEEYKRRYEAQKKQIQFDTRNTKFNSTGVKTRR
ncbi:hypothetical protein AAIR98_001238 [Elusimicrobium simillimum]|uniref:hypothetical protein n=1 Tax=Elusimicrobium simillimum TaxID=3143438 RepID=UPI003C6F0159